MSEPTDQQPADEQPAEQAAAAPEKPKLPTLKEDLVALAISRGIASYTAWAMTVPELTEKLGG